MEHSFCIEVASSYGIECAIIIRHFQFWIGKNAAHGRHFHEDHFWTYASSKDLNKIFPYMSQRVIETKLKFLVDEGILIKGNFNQSTYDRTLWYAFHDSVKWIPQFSNLDTTKRANGFRKSVKSLITDTITDTKTDQLKINIWPTFEDFKRKYDKNVGMKQAEKFWNKLNQQTREAVMVHLEDYIPATPDKRFRKDADKYLKNESYKDEIINHAQRIVSQAGDKGHTADVTLARLSTYTD